MNGHLESIREATRCATLTRRIGFVRHLSGLAVEASGPDAVLGEICTIATRDAGTPMLAEVVGMRPGLVTLMPYGTSVGLAPGCEVIATGAMAEIGVGSALLGRVIDGFGNALDDQPAPRSDRYRPVRSMPLNPMLRPRITSVLETGIRSIDSLLTLGKGQRVGIFAGSGVGKSTLLGQIARHVRADVNVIALIGERGREVREFVEKHLAADGLARSVVVVATSDQPALARLRAAYSAVAISEYFRDAGRHVLLTMDSVTRFAMARREVGLAAGEPPTARGYTPSVFTELPALCERCGTSPGGGTITALLTVLVEGDDLNEPIADCLRATLDGHIVLSRDLAHRGMYPAVDVLRSASRLLSDVAAPEARALAGSAIKTLAILERSRQLVEIGAYVAGSRPELDRALSFESELLEFLSQSQGGADRNAALDDLAAILGSAA
jgi:flagellum-specific ATP synthase